MFWFMFKCSEFRNIERGGGSEGNDYLMTLPLSGLTRCSRLHRRWSQVRAKQREPQEEM